MIDKRATCQNDSQCGIGGHCIASTCSCGPFRSGIMCESVNAGYSDYTPREGHGAAYDAVRGVN